MKLGYLIAACDNHEQAELLNELGRAARRTWTGGFTGSIDDQLCLIVDFLDDDGRRLVERLAAFIRSDSDAKVREALR